MADTVPIIFKSELAQARKDYEAFLREVGQRPATIGFAGPGSNTVAGGVVSPTGAAISTGGAGAAGIPMSPAVSAGGIGSMAGGGSAQQFAEQFASAVLNALRTHGGGAAAMRPGGGGSAGGKGVTEEARLDALTYQIHLAHARTPQQRLAVLQGEFENAPNGSVLRARAELDLIREENRQANAADRQRQAQSRAEARQSAATARAEARQSSASTRGIYAAQRDIEHGTPYSWSLVEQLGQAMPPPPPPRSFMDNFRDGVSSGGFGKQSGAGGFFGGLVGLYSSPMGVLFSAMGAANGYEQTRNQKFQTSLSRGRGDYLRSRSQEELAMEGVVPGTSLWSLAVDTVGAKNFLTGLKVAAPMASPWVDRIDPNNFTYKDRAQNFLSRAEEADARRGADASFNEIGAQEASRRFIDEGRRSGGEYGASIASERSAIQTQAQIQRGEYRSQRNQLRYSRDMIIATARMEKRPLNDRENTIIAARETEIGALLAQEKEVDAAERFQESDRQRQEQIRQKYSLLSLSSQANRSRGMVEALAGPSFMREFRVGQADLRDMQDANRASEKMDRQTGRLSTEELSATERANRGMEAERQARIKNAMADFQIGREYESGLLSARAVNTEELMAGVSPARAALTARRRSNRAEVRRLEQEGDFQRASEVNAVQSQEMTLALRNLNREEQLMGAGIAFSNESIGIQIDMKAGRPGEQMMKARTNEILRGTQMQAVQAFNGGQRQLVGGILQGGELQLQAQAQQYLAGFRSQEVNLARTAGTADPQSALNGIAKAIENLKNIPTEQGLRQIISEAVEKLDRTQ